MHDLLPASHHHGPRSRSSNESLHAGYGGCKYSTGLETLGDIVINHKNLTMEFTLDGKRVVWKGDEILGRTHLSEGGLKRMIGKGDIAFLCQLHGDEGTATSRAAPEPWEGLQKVLKKYKAVEEEPRGLPPLQTTDHHILLQPDVKPINIHPYRYPHFQKNEIERLTREMLQQGLIRHSISPYSSSMLLVHKKDGRWRFCVDYRALNTVAIRDQFPIPTMDELLDE